MDRMARGEAARRAPGDCRQDPPHLQPRPGESGARRDARLRKRLEASEEGLIACLWLWMPVADYSNPIGQVDVKQHDVRLLYVKGGKPCGHRAGFQDPIVPAAQ